VMYLNVKPALPEVPESSDKSEKVALQANWSIAGVGLQANQLPADPAARAEAIRWLDKLHADWKSERRSLLAKWRKLLRTGASEHGILISNTSSKNRKNKSEPSSSVDLPVSPASTTTPTPAPHNEVKAELKPTREEERQIFTVLAEYCQADLSAARTIIQRCRDTGGASVTLGHIEEAIRRKAKAAREAGQTIGVGYLITFVPQFFEGDWLSVLQLPPPEPPKQRPLSAWEQRQQAREAGLRKRTVAPSD
jgi:hypothetical protein